MIAANRIKFEKIFSNELNIPDLIMDVAFDSDNSEVSTFLNREAVSSESHDGRYHNTVRYRYSERFAPRFTFMKKGFGDFSISEVRAVLKWLTVTDKPSLLDVYYDNSNAVEWSAIGGWTEIETYKLANQRTVAIVATFEATTPFALSDLHTITKKISSATDNKIIIEIDTDDNKPVYPCVTINHGYDDTSHLIVNIPSGTVYTTDSDMIPNTVYFNGTTYYWKSDKSGKCVSSRHPGYSEWSTVPVDHAYTDADVWADKTIYNYVDGGKYYWVDPHYFKSSEDEPKLATTGVKLTNKHTDFLNVSKPLSPTIVQNNNGTETIILDGANKVISSLGTNRVFDADFNLTWLPLLDGTNEITVEGNCEVTLKWREVRKIGEF